MITKPIRYPYTSYTTSYKCKITYVYTVIEDSKKLPKFNNLILLSYCQWVYGVGGCLKIEGLNTSGAAYFIFLWPMLGPLGPSGFRLGGWAPGAPFRKKKSRAPKKSSLELTVWVPLVWVALFSLVYLFLIFTTYEPWPFFSGGGGGGGGVYFIPLKFFRYLKMNFYFFYFLNVLTYLEERFLQNFGGNKPKIELVDRKWNQK